jgi:hypothetical protein
LCEKYRGARWEVLILEDLKELFNGFGFSISVNSNRFPKGNTILRDLL